MAKAATPKKPLTKTELLANIAAATELPKTQVAAVLNALAAEIQTRAPASNIVNKKRFMNNLLETGRNYPDCARPCR